MSTPPLSPGRKYPINSSRQVKQTHDTKTTPNIEGLGARERGAALLRGDRRRRGGAEEYCQRTSRTPDFGGDAGEASAGGVQFATCQAGPLRF